MDDDMRYYLGGSIWGGINKLYDFLKDGIWQNGRDNGEFFEIVNAIPVGSKIAIKSTSTKGPGKIYPFLRISLIGTVTKNHNVGRKLDVEWEKYFNTFDLDRFGGRYRSTIHDVTGDRDTINRVFKLRRNPSPLPTDTKKAVAFSLNQVLYGPPGTGKTYHTRALAVAICQNQAITATQSLDRQEVNRLYADLEKEGRIVFTTFHQSLGYEDFIEGIKPDVDIGHIKYEVNGGILRRVAAAAKQAGPFVLIIDEINRGNVSAIFGELITLIEDGKRAGQAEEIEVTLPYSQEKFKLPANLYIIGTMNTADRSVEALDTALRRRFVFQEMMPEPDLLKDLGVGVDMPEVLSTFNARLTYLKDKNHTIGHAFFMGCGTAVDVIRVIAQKILPLLEEFFYGETVKIGMVLSAEFLCDGSQVKQGSTLFHTQGIGIARALDLDLTVPTPRRSLTGPELLDKLRESGDAQAQEEEAQRLIASIIEKPATATP